MNESSPALAYSAQPKLTTTILSPMSTREDLSKAYTPGIAEVCKVIEADPAAMFTHTFRRNNLAVISDGSAVLGLGNIGHKASYPVMEGKAMLFKRFGKIDAIPIIVNTQDSEEFITAVARIADSFAAINLEDIAAPRCFEIEESLKEMLEIPVMHDDQHGTAVVVLAAVINALELSPKRKYDTKIVAVGAGAAGIAIVKLLLSYGFTDVTLVDSRGIVSGDRSDLTAEKLGMVPLTNPEQRNGDVAEALRAAEIFIGVSRAGLLTPELVKLMAPEPIVIAMANPVPEILPEVALAAGVAVMATGRSDFANQVNNALAFPGIFRAAIDTRSKITEKMKVAAAEAILEYHRPSLSRENLLPSILDGKVHEFIAEKVRAAV
ncbi:MAG: NADP-dependent malic enzyme [bacterium]|nr:NADP-dependent malic enzyme [bacterium]